MLFILSDQQAGHHPQPITGIITTITIGIPTITTTTTITITTTTMVEPLLGLHQILVQEGPLLAIHANVITTLRSVILR